MFFFFCQKFVPIFSAIAQTHEREMLKWPYALENTENLLNNFELIITNNNFCENRFFVRANMFAYALLIKRVPFLVIWKCLTFIWGDRNASKEIDRVALVCYRKINVYFVCVMLLIGHGFFFSHSPSLHSYSFFSRIDRFHRALCNGSKIYGCISVKLNVLSPFAVSFFKPSIIIIINAEHRFN